MKTLEVRCCCKPEKLLGWVEVPDHIAVRGMYIVGTLRMPTPIEAFSKLNETPTTHTAKPITFPIELYGDGRATRLAVKAEGYEGTLLETLLMPWNFRPALTPSDRSV